MLVVSESFREHVNKYKEGGNSLPVNSGMFSKFLSTQGITWTQLERRKKTEEFDLDGDGEICLLEYLMMQHKGMILKQYFLRTGYAEEEITKDLTEASGVITDKWLDVSIDIGEALVTEMFEHPYGVDKVLDGGLIEFSKIMKPRYAKMDSLQQLIDSSDSSPVKKMKAQQELKQMQEEVQQPLQNTKVKFAAAIKKVRQKQNVDFKETLEAAKTEIAASSLRKGTIGNLRRTYVSAAAKKEV